MAFGDVDLASSYFMQRLNQTRQAQNLSASSRFNLARSPLSDDELEDIVDSFRDSPRSRDGWGIAPMLNEVLSRSPKEISTKDIGALQKNLVASGYMPPGTSATGTWDESWYAAFRRWDRDNLEAQRAGRHWYSAPVEAGVRAMTNTLPSRVWQGIVGGAKGVVMQAPETAERVGLAGGAVGGAAIGAAAGSVIPGLGTAVGAGVGALAGAGIGFFSDLFGDDEGEEDQSLAGAFLDALSPWEEYRAQGPKAFWEDVGFVLTAASLVQGGGAAISGATGAARALGAARLTPEAGATFTPVVNSMIGARSAGQAGTVVGQQLASKGSWVKAALLPSKAAGRTELGIMGTLYRAATASKSIAPGSVAWYERLSPIAFAQRHGPNIALKTFAGTSQAAMGARLFGGLGAGSSQAFVEAREALSAELGRDLTEEELLELSKKTARTSIEKGIAETAPLETGIKLPLIGDLVDVAAFVVYPEKLLPFRGAEVARSATRLLGDTTLYPYIHAVQSGTDMSLAQARAKVKEVLTPEDNAWLRTDYGVHEEAAKRVRLAYGSNSGAAAKRGAYQHARADVVRELLGELDRGKKDLLTRLQQHSLGNEEGFTRFLIDLDTEARGLDKLSNWKRANQLARKTEREVQERTRLIRQDGKVVGARADLPVEPRFETFQTPAGPVKQRVSTQEVKLGGVRRTGPTPETDIRAVQAQIDELQKRVKAYRRYADRRAQNPADSIAMQQRARLAESEITSLKKTLADLKRPNRTEVQVDRFRIAPARKDFLDKQDLFGLREDYLRLRDEVANAPTDAAFAVKHQEMRNFVEGLRQRGIVDEKLMPDALVAKPGKKIADELEELAHGAAARVDLPENLARQFDELGYKPVAVGDDVLYPHHLEGVVETAGIGDYTRRAAFFETLGASPRWRSNKNLFQLRRAHETAEMTDVLRKHGIPLSADDAFRRIHDHLRKINHDGAVIGPFSIKSDPNKALGKKIDLYKIDTRDMSPDHILGALEDVTGVTDEVARDIFGALRRGAAYGAEAHFLHPVQTMRSIGRTVRVNGLPGFADVMRTLHADVPGRLNRKAFLRGDFDYRPVAELAKSPERRRVMTGLAEISRKTSITKGQRQLGEAMLDATVQAQVKAGRFASVDDAYGAIDLAYAERYVEGMGQGLFQTRERAELEMLYGAFKDKAEWYDASRATLQSIFRPGMRTAFPARSDGATIDDLDLFTQILAATSPRTPVPDNMTEAIEVYKLFKQGSTDWGSIKATGPSGKTVRVMRSKWKMLDDIAKGRTVDQWDEATRQGVYKVGEFKGMPRETRERMKVWNFYHNLSGDLDKVTVDTWMGTLFGYPVITPAHYDDIEREIQAVAELVGDKPARVQAALWVAAKEDMVARGGPKNLLDARSFADLSEPLRETVMKFAAEQNPHALLQRVEDDILGMTQFGADYRSIIRVFRDGDFSTLAHENGHLLRRLLPEEDVARLERAYGVRTVRAPEGASDDLRSIAREYHEQSGIPTDARALDEYAEVNDFTAREIADAYEAGKHSPKSREVKRAYDAFKRETLAQYDLLVKKGYVPLPSTADPYPNSKAFIDEVRGKKTLRYFKSGDMGDNPLGESAGRVVKDIDGNDYDQSYNDIFRWVHDIFGHAKEGLQTGARGEENAWRQHARMYSAEARRAMTTETRGQNSWVNFGPHLRRADGTIPKKGDPDFVPPQDRPFADQKAMLLPERFSQVDDAPRWPRAAEERFAHDFERYILGKTGQLGPSATPPGFDILRDAVGALWGNMRGVAYERNTVPRSVRKLLDKTLPLPESLVPPSRARTAARAVGSKQALGGAAIGAGMGALEGDEGLEDVLRGLVYGGAAGLVTRSALQRTYGYLPDALTRLNTALRFTLSFTFDLGRYTEQNMIAMAKHQLPPMVSPMKNIKGNVNGWKSPYRSGRVHGDEAWRDAMRFWDEINGTTYFQNLDDLDRRMYQKGLLGFSPRNWEAAQAFQMYQRGWSAEKIEEAVSEIGRYGLGRTAAEKSANFIVFPFSFSKKFLTTLGDFILQAPGRNLLLHEGLRRYHESEVDDKVDGMLEKYAPLLEELFTVNNLAFGLSPGRFFLQGLSDHRTAVGQASQALASFFVPSGAATPLAEAAGNLGDLSIHAFTPIILTGESINRAGGIDSVEDVLRRYVPMVREIDQYFTGEHAAVPRQARALMEGGDPFHQFSSYFDEKKAAKAEWDLMAMGLGYSSVDGFLQSDAGSIIAQPALEQNEIDLARKYPSGFRMAQEFTNQDNLDAVALVDLAEKDNRSKAEDQILSLVEELETMRSMYSATGIDPDVTEQLISAEIRSRAERWADDPRFAELWERFFMRTYGPIRRVA